MVISTHDHSCIRVDRLLELFKIDGPFRSGRRPSRSVLGWMKRNVSNLAAGHFDVADIPMPDVSSMRKISNSFLDH